MSDLETLQVYAAKAGEYADLTASAAEKDPIFEDFLAALPARADLLDLGCGPGHFAARMADAGHRVTALDAVAEMVERAACHPGVTARQASFDEVDGTSIYDGIWANFSLLHAPKAKLPTYLSALRKALREGGLFHIAVKEGEREARDSLGRHYSYYTAAELTGLLGDAGLQVTNLSRGCDKGLDGTLAPWIALRAHG